MAPSPESCLVCGKPLIYFNTARELTCEQCGQSFMDKVCCCAKHYVCDTCHRKSSLQAITDIAEKQQSKNPFTLMNTFMDQPQTHLHGPEHHALTPIALLVAYHHAGGDIDLSDSLAEALHRGEQVPGGTCGFWGACGAAIGAGIFLSIVTKATPLKREHYDDVNRLTSQCLSRIATVGGPRCCKRNSYLSIRESVHYVRDNVGVTMELPEKITCHYHWRNKECLAAACPFFDA